jgi:O-acetylserine/cysteine efflux transporter
MKTSDIFLALLTVMLWSSNFIAVKYGVINTSVETFNLIRFGCCLPLLLFIKKPQVHIGHLALIALFFNVLNFWFIGRTLQQGTSIGVAAFLFQTSVLFGILFSLLINKEVPTISQILGCIISFAGIWVLSYSAFHAFNSMSGIIECILSAACWGIGFALLKKYRVTGNASVVVWITCLSFFILLSLDLVCGARGVKGILNITIKELLAALYALVVVSLFGCVYWFRLTQKYNAALLGSFVSLTPIFAIIFSYIVFLEHISRIELVGGSVIVIGLFVSHINIKRLSIRFNQ